MAQFSPHNKNSHKKQAYFPNEEYDTLKLAQRRNNLLIQLFMKQILLFLSIVTLLNAQTIFIDTGNTTGITSFQQLPLNLSQLNSTAKADLEACLQLAAVSNTIIGGFEWSWGYQRVYSDGFRQFYLYLKVRDSKNNSREVETIVAADLKGKVFTLLSVNENILNSFIQNGTDSSFQPITRPPLAHSATTAPLNLNDIYKSYSNGFDQLNQAQILDDNDLASLQTDVAKSYPIVQNSAASAIFSKKLSELSTAYLMFYVGESSEQVWIVYGVVDNKRKVHYIISVVQVDTSALGKGV